MKLKTIILYKLSAENYQEKVSGVRYQVSGIRFQVSLPQETHLVAVRGLSGCSIILMIPTMVYSISRASHVGQNEVER